MPTSEKGHGRPARRMAKFTTVQASGRWQHEHGRLAPNPPNYAREARAQRMDMAKRPAARSARSSVTRARWNLLGAEMVTSRGTAL